MLPAAGPAAAHGFGQRYDLPIPLWLFVTGAGLTVAVSFLMMALFVRAVPASHHTPRLDLMRTWPGRALAAPAVLTGWRLIGVALYLLVICAGLFGQQSPLRNIAPAMVWAIWWVGMAYISALIGNLWAIVNPLDTLFAWAEALYARLRSGRPLAIGLRYPDSFGVWPSVALFLAFVWMELVWENSDTPASLAAAILAYSAFTWFAMLLFGRTEWLRRGEVFSVAFAILARFAPTETRVVDREACAQCRAPQCGRAAADCIDCADCWNRARAQDRAWNLRPFAVGLLVRQPVEFSRVVLVVLMLASVSFDGFLETPAWAAIMESMVAPTRDAAGRGEDSSAWVQTLGLVAAPVFFLAVYLAFCRLIVWCGESPAQARSQSGQAGATLRIAGLFVFTLVPIAIAYHLAHYLSFLVMAGQYLIPLASDPFGAGWDLFGSKMYFIRIGIIDARAVWYVSLVAIVTGHIAAVYLAHVLALREFPERKAALRSQYPMLILMISYTMVSLWIMAQPIVAGR